METPATSRHSDHALGVNLKSVDYYCSDQRILEGINYQFPLKGMLCVYGGIESGKSDLLAITARIKSPSKGKIYYHKGIREVSYISKLTRPILKCTVEQKLSFIEKTLPNNNKKQFFKTLFREFNEVFHFGKFLNQRIETLSLGRQQLLLYLIALAKGSDLTVLDDLFQGLDLDQSQKMMRLLIYLASKRENLIIFSHQDFSTIKQIGCEGIKLHHGKIITGIGSR